MAQKLGKPSGLKKIGGPSKLKIGGLGAKKPATKLGVAKPVSANTNSSDDFVGFDEVQETVQKEAQVDADEELARRLQEQESGTKITTGTRYQSSSQVERTGAVTKAIDTGWGAVGIGGAAASEDTFVYVPPPTKTGESSEEKRLRDEKLAHENEERFKRVTHTSKIDDSMAKLKSQTDDFFSMM